MLEGMIGYMCRYEVHFEARLLFSARVPSLTRPCLLSISCHAIDPR